MRGAITFFCAVILVWSAGMARGQSWEPTYGPMGNTPYSITEINHTLFIGTDWGNFRSYDGGDSWEKLTWWGCPEYFYSYASFWASGKRIYSNNNFSTDNGDTWNAIGELPEHVIK